MESANRRASAGAGPLRIGLTGGIACGKSVVLRRLASSGMGTLDLDAVARALMAPGGAAYEPVLAAFGEGYRASDGTIDRKRLAERVFADEGERRRLESVVHPLIRQAENRWAASLPDNAVVVVDGALLVEAGLHLRFARLVVVHCDRATQVSRLMARDGVDERSARVRIEAQLDVTAKRRFGHFEIDSGGRLADTEALADNLVREIRGLCEARAGEARRVDFARALAALQHGFAEGPRGLDPVRFLEALVRDGEVNLASLGRALVPSEHGPWYEAAREAQSGRPEALAVPLVVWAASRRDADEEWLVSAAASLARLTHRDGVSIAGACLVALASAEVLASEAPARSEWRSSDRVRSLARRWGGAEPMTAVERAIGLGCRWAHDPDAARREALGASCDAGVAGAVAGLIGGKTTSPWPRALVACLEPLTTRAK